MNNTNAFNANNNINKNEENYNKAYNAFFQKINSNMEEMRKKISEAKSPKSENNQRKIKQKCHQIASRILAGQKVSQKDKDYLKENDPELYAYVMYIVMLQKNNENKNNAIPSFSYTSDGVEESSNSECIYYD